MALLQAGTPKPDGVTNPVGALTLTPSPHSPWYSASYYAGVRLPKAPDKLHSPMKSTVIASNHMVYWSGGASVGILKPTVGASATLAPVIPVTGVYYKAPAPLQPVITPSKVPGALGVTGWEQAIPPPPPPESVSSLSWITVGLLAAAGVAAYLIFH